MAKYFEVPVGGSGAFQEDCSNIRRTGIVAPKSGSCELDAVDVGLISRRRPYPLLSRLARQTHIRRATRNVQHLRGHKSEVRA
jgi:hypothetical protein